MGLRGHMRRYITVLSRLFAELCGWLLIVLMLLLVVDFVSRGFSMPIVGTSEIAVFVMVATVFLGLAHCEHESGHVRLEMILCRFSQRVQLYINLVCYLIAIVAISFALFACGDNALSAFQDHEAIASPVLLLTYPVKFVMTIALFFYLCQLVIKTAELVSQITNKHKDVKINGVEDKKSPAKTCC